MNALQELTDAYQRLADLRDAATGGPWTSGLYIGPITGVVDGSWEIVADEVTPDDAQLITALHRTIDVQQKLLRAGIAAMEDMQWRDEELKDSLVGVMLQLARAINGPNPPGLIPPFSTHQG